MQEIIKLTIVRMKFPIATYIKIVSDTVYLKKISSSVSKIAITTTTNAIKAYIKFNILEILTKVYNFLLYKTSTSKTNYSIFTKK